MESVKVEDLQERFLEAVKSWEAMSDADRQSLLDHTAMEMTMQNLKKAGLVEGEGELDLEVCGMLYGYAYAKGFRPNMSKDNIAKMLGGSSS